MFDKKSAIVKGRGTSLENLPLIDIYIGRLCTKFQGHWSGGDELPHVERMETFCLLKYTNFRIFSIKVALAPNMSIFLPCWRKQKLSRIKFYPRKHTWHVKIRYLEPSGESQKELIMQHLPTDFWDLLQKRCSSS